MDVSLSALDFIEGVGPQDEGLGSRIGGLLDWLAEALEWGEKFFLNIS